MTIQEYNTKFYPRYKNAKLTIVNMEHAIEKCDNPDAVRYQLECIGWNEDTRQFLLKALDNFKDEVLKERARTIANDGRRQAICR